MKVAIDCRSLCFVTALLVAGAVANATDAASSQLRHLTVGGEADDAEGQQLYAAIGFPIGRSGWTDLSFGESQARTSVDAINTTMASAAAGFDAERVALAVRYTHREDSSSFRQRDLDGKITLLFPTASLGLRAFYRSAKSETITSIERRRRDPLAVRLTESLEGYGFGLNGQFEPSDNLMLVADFIKYDYEHTTNRPVLLQRLAVLGVSVTTREQAFLDASARAGATYAFETFSLSADYYLDRTLDTRDELHTGQLTVTVPLGERWTLIPWIGYASNDPFESVAFAGMSVSVFW